MAILRTLTTAVTSTLFLVSARAQGVSLGIEPLPIPHRGLSFGLAFNGQRNFSDQLRGNSAAVEQKHQTSAFTSELLGAYTWPKGWRVESGVGVGSIASVAIYAQDFGSGEAASFETFHVPLRLYRHFRLGAHSRFTLSPHLGTQFVSLPFTTGSTTTGRGPIFSGLPSYGSVSRRTDQLLRQAFTYQAGVGFNYIAPRIELNFFARYTNGFGRKTVAEAMWEYDREGIEQPSIRSRNYLQSVTVGIAVRRTFFAH
jgi:hypothetical protein